MQSPILLETKIRFKRELRNRELVYIFSQAKKVDGKIMTLSQVMVKSDGKVAAEAEFIIGYFDMRERKLITPTQEWLKIIGFLHH
jgi:acyl-CoA thioester hydrolase